jgi:hypothetical protein
MDRDLTGRSSRQRSGRDRRDRRDRGPGGDFSEPLGNSRPPPPAGGGQPEGPLAGPSHVTSIPSRVFRVAY